MLQLQVDLPFDGVSGYVSMIQQRLIRSPTGSVGNMGWYRVMCRFRDGAKHFANSV